MHGTCHAVLKKRQEKSRTFSIQAHLAQNGEISRENGEMHSGKISRENGGNCSSGTQRSEVKPLHSMIEACWAKANEIRNVAGAGLHGPGPAPDAVLPATEKSHPSFTRLSANGWERMLL